MNASILWADDEIDLLKPHILFLSNKGYTVDKVTNGVDAIEKVKSQNYDVIFLDENMPGISGIETLAQIKQLKPDIPIVMITKSEEEHIMEDAIGNQIADYLIKPVNSSQILLSLKKILDGRQLVTEKTAQNYQQEFRQLSMDLYDVNSFEGWVNMYRKLVYWELELAKSGETGMDEILAMQKRDANNGWSKFVKENYLKFLKKTDENTPSMSHTVFNRRVIPLLKDETPTFLILIQ
jgi:DNA-binding NtrC family response regulator